MSSEADRWAELRAFIAEWYRPLEPRDGLREGEIEAAEKRLGIRLPEALRELYQMAGMYLYDCLEVAELPEPVLSIYHDEISTYSYAVPLSHIDESDPPVVMLDDPVDGRTVGTVSEWAFYQIVKNRCYMGASYSNSAYSMYCPSRVRLTGVQLLYSLGEYEDEFWTSDGVLVWTRDCQRWIQLLAKTSEEGEAFVCENQAHLIWKEMPDCTNCASR